MRALLTVLILISWIALLMPNYGYSDSNLMDGCKVGCKLNLVSENFSIRQSGICEGGHYRSSELYFMQDKICFILDGNLVSQSAWSGILGDIDGNRKIELRDAIMLLKVSNRTNVAVKILKRNDVTGDGKVEMSDAVFVLQMISEIR